MLGMVMTNAQPPGAMTPPAPGNPLVLSTPSAKLDLRSLGATGLAEFGGFVTDAAPLRELEGHRGLKLYREMSQTDAACASIIYAIEKLIRQVPWRVAPASTADYDIEAADFLQTCMDDMEGTWHDFVAENMKGMLVYGHALVECVYKRRAGESPQAHLNSRFADGRIGWRDLASRSQDTIYRWVYDDNGRLLGAEQQAPPKYRLVYLPLSKCVLFRTAVEKGSPLGVSIFRSAYKSWYIKRGLESLEAVGAERDLCGIPVVWLPQEILQAAEDGDAQAKALVESYYKLATNIRQDAQQGIVMPLAFDDKGNKMFDLQLLGSAGSKQYNANDIIKRHTDDIYRTVLADFIALGGSSGGTGSWAMHDDKTKLFLQALKSFIDTFVESLNKQAVRPLMKLNGLPMSECPRIEAGELNKVDPGELADTLLKLSQAGMPLFPDPELDKYIRELCGLPEAVAQAEEDPDVLPQPNLDDGPQKELVDPAAPAPLPEAAHQATLAGAAPADALGAPHAAQPIAQHR